MTSATRLDPIGATEAARLIGVQRSNFVRDWAGRQGFPAPVGTLSRGRLWDRGAVIRYALANGPLRGTALSRIPMSPAVARLAPLIKRRIVRQFQPLRIVIFGSQVRGDAQPDSDIDVFVVMPDGSDERETQVAIRRALADLPVAKDVLVRTVAKVERYADIPGTMVHEALRTGVTVYARS